MKRKQGTKRQKRNRVRKTVRRRQRGGVSDTPTSATIQGIPYVPKITVVVAPLFVGTPEEFLEREERGDGDLE